MGVWRRRSGGELLRRSRRARRDTETQPRNRAFAVRSHTVQTERPRGNVHAVQALRERSLRMKFYVSEMVRLAENPRHATGHATRDGSSNEQLSGCENEWRDERGRVGAIDLDEVSRIN